MVSSIFTVIYVLMGYIIIEKLIYLFHFNDKLFCFSV